MSKDIFKIIENRIYGIIKKEILKRITLQGKYDTVNDIDLKEVIRLKKQYGIGGIILDVDETLRKDMQDISQCNKEWLDFIRSEFKISLVSNGYDKSIKELAKKMNIPYISLANKPLRKKMLEAANLMGLEPENILVIGDSIFSDVYGGKRSGMNSAIVEDVR